MTADPLVGLILDGRYRIVSRVARGGMATVYAARDIKLGREIAVKVMHPTMAQDEEFVARFIGEAKSAAGLSHPNVVAVYDQGSSGRHVFLVMEYVPGRTLRDLLNERGRLGPRQALSLMQPILAALGAAHRAGLVHRDVKPENVLLTDDGQVKVADFGLARAETAGPQTRTGLIIGTVAYVAPEQVVSSSSDARSDVYATGIMLFELLTGRQPHQGENPLAVAYKHVNEVVPPPSSVLPGLPPQLDALVAAATARDPASRPPDADHFLAAVAGVDRALPPDIDQALAHATPAESQNATAVLQLPPMPPQQAPYQQSPMPLPSPHASLLPPGLLGRHRQHSEEPAVIDRVLAAFTSRFVLIGVGLVALLVLGGAIWYQTAGQHQDVPNVIGLTISEARAKLEAKGYQVAQGPGKNSDQVEKGKVAYTDPASGSHVSNGAIITLFPSQGRAAVTIPDLKGKSQDEAQQQLTQLGFTTTIANEPSADVGQGLVIRTQPAAGESAQPGPGSDPITIYVSTGDAGTGTPVPNVVGKSPDEATRILQGAGFQVNIIQRDALGGEPKNTVLSQSPQAGTNAGKGALITLIATKNDSNNGNGNGNGNGNSNEVQVPNVIGQSYDQAVATLQAAGFQVKKHGHPFDGPVQGQDPQDGTAPRGSSVSIWG